jgi:OmpA-OmpF porin, OOP family
MKENKMEKNISSPRTFARVGIAFAIMLGTACAIAPKDELSRSANPREEIVKISRDLQVARAADIDVMARKDYLKSYTYVELAKKDLEKEKDQEKIIDDLRFAKESLKKAYSVSENRREKAPGLFDARQNAAKAGAAVSLTLRADWESIDDDVADIAHRLEKVSIERLEKLQNRYVELEKMAVVESSLGKPKSLLNGALNRGALKKAPKTTRLVELSLRNAESLIGNNIRNPTGYNQAVAQAESDAGSLSEVMDAIDKNGDALTEAGAVKIATQNRQIKNLKSDLSGANSAGRQTHLELSEQQDALREKNIELQNAQTTIAIQKALETSRQQFSKQEAEAFQQGDSLVIRLKAINFPSGRSELPTISMPLLAKVSSVAKALNAKELTIEGHTDSIGSVEGNKALSLERAQTVATYFTNNGFNETQVTSNGHGFDRPIASNRSKNGRAQNRRVDVIITPADNVPSDQELH